MAILAIFFVCHRFFFLFYFQILKRASSVPSRTECDEKLPPADGQQTKPIVPCTTIYQETNERTGGGITPSTTDESVKTTTTTPSDPLLRQSTMASDNATRDLLPHLPNITPVRGHINYQGWL